MRRRKGRSRAGHVHELGAPSVVGAAHAEEGVRQERHHENVLDDLLVDRCEDGLSWRWDTGRSGWRSRRCSSSRPRHCRRRTQAGCKLVRLDKGGQPRKLHLPRQQTKTGRFIHQGGGEIEGGVRLVMEHLDHPVLHRVRAQHGLAVYKGVFNLRRLHLELPTVHRGIKGLAKAGRDGSLGPRRVVPEGPAFSPRTRACLADSASEMQRQQEGRQRQRPLVGRLTLSLQLTTVTDKARNSGRLIQYKVFK